MIERGLVRRFGDKLIGTCFIHVFGENGVTTRVEAMVDSGFVGGLSLKPDLVDSLQLRRVRTERAYLADGSSAECDMYRVDVHWQGDVRNVEVVSLNGPTLIGMGLLRGSELRMVVEEAGEVEITPLE